MSEDCERWAELADRRMLEEPVSADEAQFLAEHAESCAACRAEAKAWDDFADSEQQIRLEEPDAHALVARALEAVAQPSAKKLPLAPAGAAEHPGASGASEVRGTNAEAPIAKKLPLRDLEAARRAKTRRTLAAASVVLALAAGVAITLRSPAPGPAPAATVAVLESASGNVTSSGAPVVAGAGLAAGARIDVGPGARACIAFDGGKIRSCLDQGASLSLTAASGAQRRLTLHQGTVVTALDKLPAGSAFTVDAEDGEATVTGTIFSVTRAAGDKSVAVRVHEGSVRTRAGAASRSVTAGNELELGPDRSRPVDPSVERHELELLGLAERAAARPVPETTSTAAPPEPPPSASSAGKDLPPKPSPADMLGAARKLRASGNSSGAAEAYRALMTAHPKSAEAHAALLSLAELQLGPLGDAAGALRSYDAYLRSGGGLSQEARYGRIQALGRLGRRSEERVAIEEFVRAYPNSVQARALAARIDKPD
ncbi:MAG: FecR domain-containing protein [Myxococcales bacterium]|nr:FecR domain-containing protein [Myxococcales bacterium]